MNSNIHLNVLCLLGVRLWATFFSRPQPMDRLIYYTYNLNSIFSKKTSDKIWLYMSYTCDTFHISFSKSKVLAIGDLFSSIRPGRIYKLY